MMNSKLQVRKHSMITNKIPPNKKSLVIFLYCTFANNIIQVIIPYDDNIIPIIDKYIMKYFMIFLLISVISLFLLLNE